MNKDITLEDKMVIIDGTDIMIIGGYGNVSGNLNLLQYSNDEIKEMIKENNDEEDNIRLIQSLLKTIRWQKHQLEEKDKVIDEAINFIINHSKPEPPYYEYLKFYNIANSSELLEILERGKNGKNNYFKRN